MNTTYGSGNSGRSAKLFVDYGTGFQLNQLRPITSGLSAFFSDVIVDSQNVPATGVELVSFTIGPIQ